MPPQKYKKQMLNAPALFPISSGESIPGELLLSRAHFRFDSRTNFRMINYIYNLLKKAATFRIEIITPVENQSYNGITTVEVKAKIYDDGDSIMNEELLITLNNSTDTTPIVDFKDAEFCFEYDLNKKFLAEPGNEYKIEIKARGGHGNWTNKILIIKCN